MVHLGSLVTTAVDNASGRRSGWRALWRLAPYARPHVGRLLLASAAMAVLALATGLYAFLVGPALRFLLTGGASALGRVAGWVPELEGAGRERLLLALPLALVGVALVKGVAYAALFTWTGQFGQRTVASPPWARCCSAFSGRTPDVCSGTARTWRAAPSPLSAPRWRW